MKLRISAVIGVVLGLLGLVALAVPEVTVGLPANDTIVLGLGAVLVLGGVREVWRRRNVEPGYAETPDTEEPVELPTPGAAFDRRMSRLSSLMYRANERQQIREEVSTVAVETVRRRFTYTEAEANAALREGTWTDDPFAAAFFTGRQPEADVVSRARELLRSGTAFQHRARRAVTELYRLAEEEAVDD